MSDIRLVDLIETELLQKIQDSFASLTGMAALTTDKDGTPITNGSNFTDFCMKYTRQSKKGAKRCEQCDRMGAEICIANGKPHAYSCHGGLIDYAAPIMIHGKMIGSFIGGQVLSKEPDLDKYRKIAKELHIDEEKYIEAVKQVQIIDKQRIDDAANALGNIAQVLSDLAYGRYLANKARKDTENAMHARNDFFAKMSHELRTPINTIIGMNEMIMRESREENVKSYAADMNVAAKSLLSLINDILDLSKLESGNMKLLPVTYDFSSLINDLINIVHGDADAKKLTLTVDVEPELPNMLFGDDVRIRQILINLLSNSIKYTQQGEVKLDISHDGYTEHGDIILVFKVTDTGMGIKEENIPALFTAYDRVEDEKTRYIEGTGLGMSIINQLLFMMGSILDVKSEYGKGSSFSFRLEQKVMSDEKIGDINERIKKITHEYEYTSLFTAPDVKLLVVDDNEANRKVFSHLLKETQINVEQADSGKDCLKKAAKTKYDLIFLDHMMPEMDGIETFHKLRSKKNGINADTPIVVLTANAVVGAREKYMSEGFTDYLSKPIIPEKLEELIAEILPDEKLSFDEKKVKVSAEDDIVRLPELLDFDWSYALTVLKSPELVKQTAEDFYRTIDKEIETLTDLSESAEDEGVLEQYKIKVHALKSTTKMIGAMNLSGISRIAEAYAINGDVEKIKMLTPVIADELKKTKEILHEWVGNEENKVKLTDYDKIVPLLKELDNALKLRELDLVDNLVEGLNKYSYDDELQEQVDELSEEVFNLRMKKADEAFEKIIEIMEGKGYEKDFAAR